MESDATPDRSGMDPAGEWGVYEEAPPRVPDALDLVLEVDGMVATFAAQRYVRVASLRAELVRDALSRGLSGDVVERSIRLELAAAMRITEYAAGMLMSRGQALVEQYPAALDALEHGSLTERHAEILVDALDDLDVALRDRLIDDAVELAQTQPVGVFRRRLRRLIENEQAETLAERHEKALTWRRVTVESLRDGMARLELYGPDVEVQAAYGRLTTMAKVMGKHADETRSVDQLRADIMGDLLLDGQVEGHPKDVRGVRPSVVVTVPALSLLSDEAARVGEPAVVEGIGPIPIQKARELCGDSSDWMRVLTHPETGMVLSVGRKRYRPPKSLAKLVKWRAGRCLGPGCSMPTERCEIDHNVAWCADGSTELANLSPFCKGHHTVKGFGLWSVSQLSSSGGVMEWISPLGRRYLVEPERTVPVFTETPDLEPEGVPPF